MLLSRDISLAEGVAGLLVLVGLQFAVAWASTRSAAAQWVVKNRPRLLYYRGTLFKDALKEERVSREDVMQALRSKEIASFDEVEAVDLETIGSISAIKTVKPGGRSTLADVAGWER